MNQEKLPPGFIKMDQAIERLTNAGHLPGKNKRDSLTKLLRRELIEGIAPPNNYPKRGWFVKEDSLEDYIRLKKPINEIRGEFRGLQEFQDLTLQSNKALHLWADSVSLRINQLELTIAKLVIMLRNKNVDLPITDQRILQLLDVLLQDDVTDEDIIFRIGDYIPCNEFYPL